MTDTIKIFGLTLRRINAGGYEWRDGPLSVDVFGTSSRWTVHVETSSDDGVVRLSARAPHLADLERAWLRRAMVEAPRLCAVISGLMRKAA